MNENELGNCRKAFEANYPGAAKYWLAEGYNYPATQAIWIDWKRAWEACRARYLQKLDEAKLAQYELHEMLYLEAQRNIALRQQNEEMRKALQFWVIAEREGGHYDRAQALRDSALRQESPEMKEATETPNAPHEGADAASSRTLPLDAVVGQQT